MKFTDIIVCDDIRREVGNKHTIVGAYADIILFQPQPNNPQWPILKPIGLFFRIIKEDGDSDFDNFKGSIFHIPFGKDKEDAIKLGNIQAQARGTKPKIFTVDIVVPLNIPGPGALHLGFQVFKKEEKLEDRFWKLIDVDVTKPKNTNPPMSNLIN